MVCRKTGLSPPVKYFTDRSKVGSFMFFLSCVCYAFVRLFICALWSPAGKGLTSWLSFAVSYCEFVTFPLVSWVSYGTWLYRFLIFTPLLTCLYVRGYMQWAFARGLFPRTTGGQPRWCYFHHIQKISYYFLIILIWFDVFLCDDTLHKLGSLHVS